MPATTTATRASQPSTAGYALIWTLYLTGARWGEATGLRVQDLDFLRRRIRIGQVNTRQGLKAYPKGRRNRTVPMPGQLAEVLAAHLAGRGGGQFGAAHPGARKAGVVPGSVVAGHDVDELPHRIDRDVQALPVEGQRIHAPNRSALVFASTTGGPVSDANFRHRVWKPAVEAAGLAELNPRIHDLRHSLASRLVQQGVPLAEIAAQLGHSSVLVSARYAHLGEGRHDAVLRALEGPDAGPESGSGVAGG